jgi:hypothetical protein
MFVAALLLFVLSGCRQESNTDPYLAAVDKYLASLDSAETSGVQVEPPPRLVYLECPVQPEPLPFVAGTGITNSTMRNTAGMGRLSTRSQARCEQTNTARKQAYKQAMQRYREIVSDTDIKAVNTGSK